MAIRQIREHGDEILTKTSKKVDVVNDRIRLLLDDMAETMYTASGVGLAAPQIGVLRRVIIIDIGEGLQELINPVIIEEEGEQIEIEGCLSLPGIAGEVKRPAKVLVKALNAKSEEITVEGEGLLARALCHEIDHLDGILFNQKAIKLFETGNNSE
ncbi:MAG: peptide deformylase [Clostridium sp.]|nr:peptide deformylase [Clostridium sp.]